MAPRTAFISGFVSAACLMSGVLWAQGSAQHRPGLVAPGGPHGPVIAGDDVGFQPVYNPYPVRGKVSGRLMVKVDGQWVEADFAPIVVR